MLDVRVILSLASPAADSGALRVAYLLMLHLNFLELVVAGFLLKEIWPFRFWQWCLPRLFQVLLLSAFGTDAMSRLFCDY